MLKFLLCVLSAGALMAATGVEALGSGIGESKEAIATGDNTKSNISQLVAKRVSSKGLASYYCCEFHGRTTASGERFNQYAMTAAHRTLKFGTRVRVTNLNNGRSVVVRISDRGPFVNGRIIDLSLGAARVIGMVDSGVAPVGLQIL